MENLIKNSCWQPGPSGGPKYFSGHGPITYDNFCLNGYRTCSITMTEQGKAADLYDLPICVQDMKSINWGYCIRSIEANNVELVAEFFDQNNCSIVIDKKDITNKICYNFQEISQCFDIPCNAFTVKLSLEFNGKITACTYCAPTAYFC